MNQFKIGTIFFVCWTWFSPTKDRPAVVVDYDDNHITLAPGSGTTNSNEAIWIEPDEIENGLDKKTGFIPNECIKFCRKCHPPQHFVERGHATEFSEKQRIDCQNPRVECRCPPPPPPPRPNARFDTVRRIGTEYEGVVVKIKNNGMVGWYTFGTDEGERKFEATRRNGLKKSGCGLYYSESRLVDLERIGRLDSQDLAYVSKVIRWDKRLG